MSMGYRIQLVAAALAISILACASPAAPTPSEPSTELAVLPTAANTLIFPSEPTAGPTHTPPPPSSTSLPVPTEWTEMALGLELKEMNIAASGISGAAVATLVRFNLDRYEPRVLYDPNGPLTVSGWQALTGSPVVVNGGFYKPNFQPDGLLISDGQPFGISYDRNGTPLIGFEGMFQVAGKSAQITNLLAERYDPARKLDQAMQSYPVLIRDSRAANFNLPERAAARTAVAIDAEGRILLINVSRGEITLTRLRDWLVNDSDLKLVSALNLCGGPATGISILSGGWVVNLDSTSQVPSAIALFERSQQ